MIVKAAHLMPSEFVEDSQHSEEAGGQYNRMVLVQYVVLQQSILYLMLFPILSN